jgi:hypothetical protein
MLQHDRKGLVALAFEGEVHAVQQSQSAVAASKEAEEELSSSVYFGQILEERQNVLTHLLQVGSVVLANGAEEQQTLLVDLSVFAEGRHSFFWLLLFFLQTLDNFGAELVQERYVAYLPKEQLLLFLEH